MNISPVFHTVSVMRMINAQQSSHRVGFPVHQNGASSILASTNFAPIPISDKLVGYSISQLQSIDRSTQIQAPVSESVGTIVDLLV